MAENGLENSQETNGGLGLGTFLGVFTPTVLTILGVILYLRLGWVVGNAGIGGALLIVGLSHVITISTALSMSALATNMRIGVGGAYFIISRSLGLEIGGALGIPLYLSQTLSVTLYAFGLAEGVRIIWPGAPVQLLAAVIVVGVVLIAARSAVLALKLQLPLMIFIGLSLISLVVGVGWPPDPQVPMMGTWEDGDFWAVFAIFFPAVTGILAGVGLSGDLKDPSKSIPLGVLSAVAVGLVVYLIAPLILGSGADEATLRSDPLVWMELAWFSPVVVIGLWGAILSSALGSVLGAPRTLQALAQDGLVPRKVGALDEESGEPMVALRITGVVAFLAVALGDLNAVATVVTMFFLTTYGMLNLAAGLEALVQDPSFRPRIRVPWWVSLAGGLGCFIAMFAINPWACVTALFIEAVIWWWIERRSLEATWGDVRTGLWMATARFAMLKLRRARRDPRNWRPNVLVFTADLARSVGMVEMASDLSQRNGIVTVCTLMIGDVENHGDLAALIARNHGILAEEGLDAFCEVAAVHDMDAGVVTVAQSNGFAGVSSNMVMLGWPGTDAKAEHLGRLLGLVRRLAGLEKSTMIMRPVVNSRKAGGEIIVWWKGRESNGDLMLLLAHLLTLSASWREQHIALKAVVDTAEEVGPIKAEFEAMLEEIRIHASVEIIVREPEQNPVEIIRARSQDASLIFVGMSIPPAGDEVAYAGRLLGMLDGLPSTVLVRNAGPFRGRLV